MFTFTTDEQLALGYLKNEKCFDNLFDLYNYDLQYHRHFQNKLVFCRENKIMCELPLKMISVKWAVACAEKVLHIFEKKRPLDNRPRLAIEAAKQWIIDQTTGAADTDVVNHDTACAAGAAYSAAIAYGFGFGDDNAIGAVADAAYAAGDAAYASTYYTTRAAVYSTRATVYAAGADSVNVNYFISGHQNWSRNKLKEIGLEYIFEKMSIIKILKHLIIPELSDIIIKYVF